MDFLKRTWTNIYLDAITHNITEIQKILSPNCQIMGVVKADAYGHGDKYIAQQMAQAGVTWFGVSNIEEAISLRRNGIEQPILIFGGTPSEYAKTLAEHNITQAVFSLEYAQQLNIAAAAVNVVVPVHIKVDTGMSRIGFLANDNLLTAVEQIAVAASLPHLKADGIFTHFSSADDFAPDSKNYTQRQFDLFMEIIAQLQKKGISFALRHCCNSAATITHPEMHLDMVRPGIICYGLSPSDDCKGILNLQPAMHLYSCITMIKKIKKGTCISYNRTFTAPQDMVIATVGIGYADGYLRALSNRGRMLVNGVFCNVVGRVCMDQLLLDVTNVPQVKAGDIATIVGEENGKSLTFDEMAHLCGTINYEHVCLIGRRVPRIYIKDQKEIGKADYILGDNQ